MSVCDLYVIIYIFQENNDEDEFAEGATSVQKMELSQSMRRPKTGIKVKCTKIKVYLL